MILLQPISPFLFWLTTVCSCILGCWALFSAPWKKLVAESIRQHLWYGCIFGLGIAWAVFGVTVQNVFHLHIVLVTVSTLVFGCQLSLLAGAVSLVISVMLGEGAWQTTPFAWLTSIAVPVFVTCRLLKIITQTRIQNLFLYTLGVGFLGGLLTPFAIGLTALGLLSLSPPYYFDLFKENIYVFFLFAFPEGFINGMLTSALAVMAPDLVKTYDDDFYLKK